MTVFILDSNFFIQAHRTVYPIDVAISFWEKIKIFAHDGKIISIDKVKDEIFNNKDALKDWLKENVSDNFFEDSQTNQVLANYKNIVQWIDSKRDHYLPRAIDEFLESKNADAWLIAYALSLVDNKFIVTHEISAPYKKSKIKIPDVCNAFDIEYVNTIEMFRRLGETF